MFHHVYTFHVRIGLKRVLTAISALLFFLIPLLLFLGTGGFFDASQPTASETIRQINSPYQIGRFLHFSGLLLLLVLPAFIAPSIHSDVRYRVFPLLYSYPLKKTSYLSATFASALTVVLLLSLLPGIAICLGEQILGTENPVLGPFRPDGYLKFYLLNFIPNILIFGIWVFVLTALSREVTAGYLFIFTLFILQIISENLSPGNNLITVLLDPFGEKAAFQSAEAWTIGEQNNNSLPITTIWLLNRLFWGLTSLLAGLFLMRTFSLIHHGWIPFFRFSHLGKRRRSDSICSAKTRAPSLSFSTGLNVELIQVWRLSIVKFRYLLSMRACWIVAGLLVLTFVVMILNLTTAREPALLPTAGVILGIPAFIYANSVAFALFFFSGHLITRDYDHRMQELIHATSVRSRVLSVSTGFSLLLLALFFLALLTTAGISTQYFSGFHPIRIGPYIVAIWGLMLPGLLIWTAVSMGVHTIVRNLYGGMLFLSLIWLGQFGFDYLGLESKLFRFEPIALMTYSDINGYGHPLKGRLVTLAYWMVAASIFYFAAHLFNPRESIHRLKERLVLMSRRLDRLSITCSAFLCSLFLVLSIIIFRAERLEFDFKYTDEEVNRFDAQFAHLADLPQPRIREVELSLDLYPNKRWFEATGLYTLKNRSGRSIDTLLIRTGYDEMTSYDISVENQLIESGDPFPFFVHRLDNPLLAGDSLDLRFTIESLPNRLFQRNSNVLANGTFLTQDILPRLGYQSPSSQSGQLGSIMPVNHYQAIDSDLVSFDITVSTSSDQTAFSIGEKVQEWQDNGRNLYRFKTPDPVKFSLFISSGRYHKTVSNRNKLPIEIYHHPDHTQNLDNILAGMQAALELNSYLFEPFTGRSLRIIEFPHSEGSFGTFKSGTMLLSESIFSVQPELPEQIRYPFYIAAHEMTHHWFGHRLLPADALGSTVLTESVSEFITMQIYANVFGEQGAGHILQMQHDRYLRGRRLNTNPEPPLIRAGSGSEYLVYGKGLLVLNRISKLLGTDRFNQALSSFYSSFNVRADSDSYPLAYPTSVDLMEDLGKVAPDSLRPLIHELFETVTLYDSRLLFAEVASYPDGLFSITISCFFQKTRNGKIVPPYEAERIEILFLDESGNNRKVVEIPILSGTNRVTFQTKFRPSRLELDPGFLYIDSNRSDNTLLP